MLDPKDRVRHAQKARGSYSRQIMAWWAVGCVQEGRAQRSIHREERVGKLVPAEHNKLRALGPGCGGEGGFLGATLWGSFGGSGPLASLSGVLGPASGPGSTGSASGNGLGQWCVRSRLLAGKKAGVGRTRECH